jgi:hypothetical protein
MKQCLICKTKKSLDSFYKDKSRKEGYSYNCKSCIKQQNKIYYDGHSKEHNLRNVLWQNKNTHKQQNYNKQSYNKLKQDIIWVETRYQYNNEYQKLRYSEDFLYKIIRLLRNRFRNAIKQKFKTKPILSLLGCEENQFKIYLESKFKPEMNWDNHGIVWEIDHIIPCSSFDLTKEEEQKQAFHYTNTQPLFKTTEIAESFGYKNEIGNRNKLNKII